MISGTSGSMSRDHVGELVACLGCVAGRERRSVRRWGTRARPRWRAAPPASGRAASKSPVKSRDGPLLERAEPVVGVAERLAELVRDVGRARRRRRSGPRRGRARRGSRRWPSLRARRGTSVPTERGFSAPVEVALVRAARSPRQVLDRDLVPSIADGAARPRSPSSAASATFGDREGRRAPPTTATSSAWHRA